MRCISLADILKGTYEISFAVQENTAVNIAHQIKAITDKIIHLPVTNDYLAEAVYLSERLNKDNILVLDGYLFDTDYQRIIKQKVQKLVCIDDIAAYHYVADVVINHSPAAKELNYSAEPYTRFYLGHKYLLLRRPFFEAAKLPRSIEHIESALLCMGGADTANLTVKFLYALLTITRIKNINILIGGVYLHEHELRKIAKDAPKRVRVFKDIDADQIVSLTLECQVAICPCSTTLFEMMAVGIGIWTGYTVDNQKGIASFMERSPTVNYCGSLSRADIDQYIVGIENIEMAEVNEQIQHQKLLINGDSYQSLIDVFSDQ